MSGARENVKQAKRQAERYTQVLDAAAACFVEEGFHNSSVSRIAERSGMSVGHIYHYFDNKNAIIKALVEREVREADERTKEVVSLDRTGFLKDVLARLTEVIEEQIDPFHSVLNMEILSEGQRNPEIAEVLRSFDRKLKKRFADYFRDELGLDDAEARVEMLFLIFQGLPLRVIRNPNLSTNELIPMIERTLKGVLGISETF